MHIKIANRSTGMTRYLSLFVNFCFTIPNVLEMIKIHTKTIKKDFSAFRQKITTLKNVNAISVVILFSLLRLIFYIVSKFVYVIVEKILPRIKLKNLYIKVFTTTP